MGIRYDAFEGGRRIVKIKFEVEIELKDPYSCNGCPFMYQETYEDIDACVLDYWDRFHNYENKRSQECIDKHGVGE